MSPLPELALKSAVLLAVAVLVARALKGASAALRHRVWALAFVGLLALPLLRLRLPEMRIERPSFSSAKAVVRSIPAAPRPLRPVAPAKPTPMPPFEPPSPWPGLFLVAWALGTLASLGTTAVGLLVALRWARRGRDLPVDPALGLPPHTRVRQTSAVDVPMTFGFLRPTVLLPEGFGGGDEDRRRASLLHEGAHVARGDWAWLVFSRLVAALYWPNPLVWLAAARLRAEAERAADDAVLRAGMPATRYAETLVAAAEGLRDGRSVGMALPFVERGALKSRVAAILGGARRAPLARRAAIAALLLGIALVLPCAAARLVAGPERRDDGVLDLGDGAHAEIVAITEMRGGHAVSWDARGALMPRAFPVGKSEREGLRPVPGGMIVRYVLFRLDGPDADLPELRTALDAEPLASASYDAFSEIAPGMSFQDALGGRYRVAQLVVPLGTRRASLRAEVPAAEWRLEAYREYDHGQDRGLFNPTLGIQLTPTLTPVAERSQVALDLPPTFRDREVGVRLLPGENEGHRFRALAGPQTVLSEIRPETVRRIEVLSRPLRIVELADLPLQPDPHATYAPRRFLPEAALVARDGRARLPDGTSLEIESVWSPGVWPGRGWNARGDAVVRKVPLGWTNGQDVPKPKNPANRLLQMWFLRRPSGATAPQTLYDGEGWPLASSSVGGVFDRGDLGGFYPALDRAIHRLDLATPVAVGPYREIARGMGEGAPGFRWSYGKSPSGWFGGKPSLRVEFPWEVAARLEGVDVSVEPLDAGGEPVQNFSTVRSGNAVEFDLDPAKARRVRSVSFRTRPYVWVRFPEVPLDPR